MDRKTYRSNKFWRFGNTPNPYDAQTTYRQLQGDGIRYDLMQVHEHAQGTSSDVVVDQEDAATEMARRILKGLLW